MRCAASGMMWSVETNAKSTRPPVRPGRHPLLIGAFESARILLFMLVASLVLAGIAWFAGIAAQRPLSAIADWAAAGLGASHGFSITLDAFTHSLPPTALSLVVWLLVASAARRTARALAANDRLVRAGRLAPSRAPWTLATTGLVGAHVLVIALLAFGLGSARLDVVGPVRLIVLVGSAAAAGMLREALAERPVERLGSIIGPRWARLAGEAWPLARRTLLFTVVLGVVGLVAAIAAGGESGLATLQGYSSPTAAAIGLGLVQTVFAPTIIVLVLSWLSGAGFRLSEHATASPLAAVDAPVVSIPVLSLIPLDPPSWAVAAPAAVVLCGLIAVIARPRWHVSDPLSPLAAAVGVFAVALLCGLFSTGSLGPGGLSSFGAIPWAFAGLLAVEAAVGGLLGWGMVRLAERGAVSPDTADR